VAVVAGVAVAADFGARHLAQNQVAAEIQSSQGLPTRPDVQITGFPFLTQLASGRFSDIEVVSASVPAKSVELSSVRARLTGVEFDTAAALSGAVTEVHVQSVDVQATVAYDALTRLLADQLPGPVSAPELSFAGAERLHLTGTLGAVSLAVEVQVRLAGDQIVVTVPAEALAAVPAAVRPLLAGMELRVTVPALPYGVKVTRVGATPDGLVLEATGRDLTLT
jgi:hypothetical protein